MTMTSWYRGLAAAAAAVVFAVAGGAPALADDVVVQSDAITFQGQTGTLGFGAVPCGADTTQMVRVRIQRLGNQDSSTFGNSVAVDVNASSSSSALGFATPSDNAVNLPSTWTTTTANQSLSGDWVDVAVTVRPTATGAGSATMTFTARGQNKANPPTIIVLTEALNASWTAGACAPAKVATTTTVSCDAAVYTGVELTPCRAETTDNVTGAVVGTPTVSYGNNINAGTTATATATFAETATHLGSPGSTAFEISKASSTTTVSCPASVVYNGSAQEPCTAVATGAGGLNQGLPTPAHEDNINVGTAKASSSYSGDSNHTGSYDSTEFEITKAGSLVTVTCTEGPFTYTGVPHAPCTASVIGDGALNEQVAVTYDDNVNSGMVTATATYSGDANHEEGSDTEQFVIGKADATCTIGGYEDVYDASAHGATGTCTGVAGENAGTLDLGASFTNVPGGTATWTFTGNSNYNHQSNTVDIVINKADATCDINGYTGTYDASAHGATGTCTGVAGENAGTLDLGASFTNAPGGTATWTFTGNSNYLDQGGRAAIEITQAPSTVNLICPVDVTYTGLAQEPCSATVSGVGISIPVQLPVVHGNNVNAGTATASASWSGDANHAGSSASDTFEILKAPSVTTVACPSGPFYFTGNPITPACTATATGVGGLSVDVLPVTFSNNVTVSSAATASATYIGDANHVGSTGSTTFTITGWTTGGFYQPVDMGGVWNIVKNGSTVPLKFELFAGTTEIASTSAVEGFEVRAISCVNGTQTEDVIELTTTGGTSLRYDTTGGQFIQNWQTPKKSGACYAVTMTARDGSTISANFKLK